MTYLWMNLEQTHISEFRKNTYQSLKINPYFEIVNHVFLVVAREWKLLKAYSKILIY
jgi:hypothetical protein